MVRASMLQQNSLRLTVSRDNNTSRAARVEFTRCACTTLRHERQALENHLEILEIALTSRWHSQC